MFVKAKRTDDLCDTTGMIDPEQDLRPDAARRLQHAREAAGFASARQAALRFGWSEFTYTQHENGTRGLARAARHYANAFKVSEGWLLTGEGEAPGAGSAMLEEARVIFLSLPNDQAREDLLRVMRLYGIGARESAKD